MDAPVVNVIISKHGSYLYILTILLIIIIVVVISIVLLTCQFRKRGTGSPPAIPLSCDPFFLPIMLSVFVVPGLDYHLRRTER